MPPGSLHVAHYLQFNMFQIELVFFFPNEISPGLRVSELRQADPGDLQAML